MLEDGGDGGRMGQEVGRFQSFRSAIILYVTGEMCFYSSNMEVTLPLCWTSGSSNCGIPKWTTVIITCTIITWVRYVFENLTAVEVGNNKANDFDRISE